MDLTPITTLAPHPALTVTDHHVQAVSMNDPEDAILIRRVSNTYAIEILDGRQVEEHRFAATTARQWAEQVRWVLNDGFVGDQTRGTRPGAAKIDGGSIEIRLGHARIEITADAAAAIVEFINPTATRN